MGDCRIEIHEAVVADLHEPCRQDALEKPPDKLQDIESQGVQPAAAWLTVLKRPVAPDGVPPLLSRSDRIRDTPMFIQEQIAFQMAKERMADAVRWAEQPRAPRRERPSMRIRLGRSLVWLGHRLADQPPAALSSHPTPVRGLPTAPER